MFGVTGGMFGGSLGRELMFGGSGPGGMGPGGPGGVGGSAGPGTGGGGSGPGGQGPGGSFGGGGSAGPSSGYGGGSSGSSGGGSFGGGSSGSPSTNPGRPGGESGVRGPVGSSSGSGISGGSESISGSTRARGSFSVNSSNAGSMMSFGDSRDIGVGRVGGVRGTATLGSNSFGSVTAGDVTSGLDPTTEGYSMIVGDNELSDDRAARESMMAERSKVTPQVRTAVEQSVIAADQNRMQEATDDNPLRSIASVFSPIPFEPLADLAENAQAAQDFNQDLSNISDQYSLSSGYFGEPGALDATQAAIGIGTGGLIGNQSRMSDVALGLDAPDTADSLNRGGGGNSEIQERTAPRPPQQVPPSFAAPSRPRIAAGDISNYGSYAKSVFSNLS